MLFEKQAGDNVNKSDNERIVITGVGIVSPCGNSLIELRENILSKKTGIKFLQVPHVGNIPAGVCVFDELKFHTKKMRLRGTRAGSISIYCAHEAINNSNIDWKSVDKERVGIFLGIAEHGSGENERELEDFFLQNNRNISLWSHQHNFKTVANSPTGEVSVNLKITGPHFTIGGACAAGNLGLIQGVQQILLGEVDYALAGGVSESTDAFGSFASFLSQGALAQNIEAEKACRPLDLNRNGLVISEGGGIFFLEKLSNAKKRNAKIFGEIVSYHYNSDAIDYLLPSFEREINCMENAIRKAGITPSDIDLVNLHATGTIAGDIQEAKAVRKVFENAPNTFINATKGFLGHAMGAASVIEIAANIPSFDDEMIHCSANVEDLDPECELKNFVFKDHKEKKDIQYILKNSFGMMGINSTIILKKI